MTESTTSIKLDDTSKAWYAGLAAAAKANETLAPKDGEQDPTFEQRLSYFWTVVGSELAKAFPEATEDQQLRFIQGAALNAPQDRAPFVLRVERINTPAFDWNPDEGDEDEDPDEDKPRTELARLLRYVADMIDEGAEDFSLVDRNSVIVGNVKLDLYR